jgi:hypothetical protein
MRRSFEQAVGNEKEEGECSPVDGYDVICGGGGLER